MLTVSTWSKTLRLLRRNYASFISHTPPKKEYFHDFVDYCKIFWHWLLNFVTLKIFSNWSFKLFRSVILLWKTSYTLVDILVIPGILLICQMHRSVYKKCLFFGCFGFFQSLFQQDLGFSLSFQFFFLEIRQTVTEYFGSKEVL